MSDEEGIFWLVLWIVIGIYTLFAMPGPIFPNEKPKNRERSYT